MNFFLCLDFHVFIFCHLFSFLKLHTGAALGIMVGSFLSGRLMLRFGLRGLLSFCCIVSALTSVLFIGLTISCPLSHVAGTAGFTYSSQSLSVPFQNLSANSGGVLPTPAMGYQGDTHGMNLLSRCNVGCGCEAYPYAPVCGQSDNVMYYNRCFAGCSDPSLQNCSCVPLSMDQPDVGGGSVVEGVCSPINCDSSLTAFIAVLFLLKFLASCISVPSTQVSLGVLPVDDRSFGLGFQSLILRLLGAFPGPVLFGSLIDNTCVVWQFGDCPTLEHRTCAKYDPIAMRRIIIITCIIIKAVGTLLYGLAWKFQPALPSANKVEEEDFVESENWPSAQEVSGGNNCIND